MQPATINKRRFSVWLVLEATKLRRGNKKNTVIVLKFEHGCVDLDSENGRDVEEKENDIVL